MRVSRSNSESAAAAAATTIAATVLVLCLTPLVAGISVPTGKVGPITPARYIAPTANPHAPAAPAPVVEYSQDRPEPPPLHPSYVPPSFDYFNTLSKHHVYYVPMRFRNFNAADNSIDYEPPQKYFGHTLGKNIGYKSYKQPFAAPAPYRPAPVWTTGYYNNQNGNNGFNNQYNNQYVVQPTQQQQYEAVSSQSPATQPPATPSASAQPQVDYTTGKGSYDVTGKGGSKSEYYGVSKADWSKKSSSVYPKKAVSSGKYASQKY